MSLPRTFPNLSHFDVFVKSMLRMKLTDPGLLSLVPRVYEERGLWHVEVALPMRGIVQQAFSRGCTNDEAERQLDAFIDRVRNHPG